MTLFDNQHVAKKLREMEAAQKLSKAGGVGRAKALTPEHRKEIAQKAANARWKPAS